LIYGVCGICEFIVGIKAMKAKVNVAIVAILPLKVLSWKNINRFMKPTTHRGTKIDTKLVAGYLYKGILKCEY